MQFHRRHKLAAAATALVAVAGTGGALAATSVHHDTARQALISDAAGRLHVSPQQLQGAMQAAFRDRLNAAVAAGRLTSAQAQRIEQRMQARGATPWLSTRRLHRHGSGRRLAVAAEYLGLSRQQLVAQLRGGKSLAQVAQARGKPVQGLQDALLAAVKTRLDEALAAGRITSAQEQRRLARAPARIQRLINRQGLHRGNAHG